MRITKTFHDSKERLHIVKDDKIILTVAPWYGAKLTQVKLYAKDTWNDILWPVSDEDLKTNAWFKQSILFPYPNRLEDGQYSFEGNTYQWPINEEDKHNQLHGMVYDHPFEVVSAEASSESATIVLIHRYDGSLDYYPFAYDLEVTYHYEYDQLITSFKVVNKGKRNMPFGLGWHPYFQINGKGIAGYTFHAGQVEEIELSDRSLPTGKREQLPEIKFPLCEMSLDNAYQLKNTPYSYSLETRQGLTLKFDASDEMDYMQIFTPEGGETVAIEPMTANINSFNNGDGIRILEPGTEFNCQATLSILS